MSTDQTSEHPSNPAASAHDVAPLPDAEMRRLEDELNADLQNVELNQLYARELMKRERFAEALDCWYRIEESRPEDPKTAKMIARLTVAANRQRAVSGEQPDDSQDKKGKEDSEHPDNKRKDFDTSHLYRKPKQKVEPKRREIELTEWQKLERAISENPANPKFYLDLADVYLNEHRDYDAQRILKKGLDPTDDDPQVLEKWEEVTLLRAKKSFELAQRQAQVENTPSAKKEVVQTFRTYQQLVLDVFNNRCKRNPENKLLRYEFGMRLKLAGDFDGAMEQFQQAADDPKHKAAANLEMGECQQRFKKYPEALQYYRQAVDLAVTPDQIDCKKLALYRAGILAAGIKLIEPARRYLSELVQLDPEFNDAAARLQQIQ